MIDVPIDRKISLVSNIRSVLNLYALMKKEKYDIVHVHTPIAAVLGRVAAKLCWNQTYCLYSTWFLFS